MERKRSEEGYYLPFTLLNIITIINLKIESVCQFFVCLASAAVVSNKTKFLVLII